MLSGRNQTSILSDFSFRSVLFGKSKPVVDKHIVLQIFEFFNFLIWDLKEFGLSFSFLNINQRKMGIQKKLNHFTCKYR